MRSDNLEWDGRRADLLRYIGRRVDDASLREDIVQEAITRFLVYQARPGVVVLSAGGLLRRITLDLARDHFRRDGRTVNVELSDDIACPQPGVQHELEQKQLLDIVTRVVKAMPRLRREVFYRRRIEGQSSRQVAEALGISPGAVDAHIARAVLDLHLAIDRIETRGGIVRG